MVTTPRGDGRSMISLEPTSLNVTYSMSTAPGGNAATWFGPNKPVAPIAPPDVAGRQWDFPAGFNLPFSPRQYDPIDFTTLRLLADTWDLLRLVIETRKDQMCRMPWHIAPRGDQFRRPGAKVPAAIQARAEEVTQFFKRPDGVTPWRNWLRELLEDHFVIDAASLYCERTRAGQLLGLSPVDGATIKRIIDPWGKTPRPYKSGDVLTDDQVKTGFKVYQGRVFPPAYQQILKNLPAVNYTTRDLIYCAENVRPNKAYGYSRVEQVLMTVNIGLRRQMFNLSYYTEGNIPESLIGVPDAWSPDQIKQFQDYWDAYFSGNMAARRRAKFVPGGVAKTFVATKEPEMHAKFDEWLARVVCFCFSISPQPFVAQVNRATAETSKNQSDEEGPEATKAYIKATADDIIETEFDPDLEFKWREEDHIDPQVQETILTGYAKAAAITLNELRDELGRDAYSQPEANAPMVYTANGYVPLTAYQEGQDRADDIASNGAGDSGGGGAIQVGGGGAGGASGKGAGSGKQNGNAGAKGGANNAATPAGGSSAAKLAKAAGRRLAPIPFVRRATRTARKGIRDAFAKAFDDLRTSVIKQLRAGGDIAKADRPRNADEIADDLDLSDLDQVTEDVVAAIDGVRADTGVRALLQLGVQDKEGLVDQVNADAAEIARTDGAQLVSQITTSTRKMIRDVIADGLGDNIGLDDIITNLQDATAFSEDRADLIARTEITDANSEAAVDGYRVARETGVKVRKAWLLGPNPCVICQENADEGDIDLDDEFPSGDDAPSAHPNCECAIVPVVDE